MAKIKDATIVLFDVGTNTEEFDSSNAQTFHEQSKCCLEKMITRKMVTRKNDEVALILIGTTDTSNDLNTEHGGFHNISLVKPMEAVNGNLLKYIHNNMKVPDEYTTADWMEGLAVAIDYFQTLKLQKCQKKILLFTTFSTEVNGDNIHNIIDQLRIMKIELTVITKNVIYDLDPMDFAETGKFIQSSNKSRMRDKGEKLIMEIIQRANGTLHDLSQAVYRLVYSEKNQKNRIARNLDFTLGTKLTLKVAVYIYVCAEAITIQERKILSATAINLEHPRTASDSVTMDLCVDKHEEPSASGTVKVYWDTTSTSNAMQAVDEGPFNTNDCTNTPESFADLPDQVVEGENDENDDIEIVTEDDRIELVSRECTDSASDVVMVSVDLDEQPSTSGSQQSTNAPPTRSLTMVTSEIGTVPCYSKLEHYQADGKLIAPEKFEKEVCKGYKYDGKVYEFDEPSYDNGGKGLRFIQFTPTQSIRSEYLKCESKIRKVVPQKTSTFSVKFFSALLGMMQTEDTSIIARYTPDDRSEPQLIALFPSQDSMLMYELSYADEIIELKYNRLRGRRNDEFKPTTAQYEFIDKFIDSMDLMGDSNSPESFKYLPDLAFQKECNSVAFALLNPNADLPKEEDADITALLSAPNKLEVADLDKMKSLFPLKENKHQENNYSNSNANQEEIHVFRKPGSSKSTSQQEEGKTKIGILRPADDFLRLLNQGESFNTLAAQIQNILIDFVRKPMISGMEEKIKNGLLIYRSKAKRNAPQQYNKWIAEFKGILSTHQRTQIWKLIVDEKLGLITINESEMCNVSFDKAQAFYSDGI